MDEQNDTDAQNINETIKIYTDGSKIEGKMGAALTIWENGNEIKNEKIKLESYCTVFQAELFAIYSAVKMAKSIGNSKIVKIISDSRSALDLIFNLKELHPIADAIRQKMYECQNSGTSIKLFLIKAHAGHMGNEQADELAKDAALKTKTIPRYDRCPISFVKRIIRHNTVEDWEKLYSHEDAAKVTKAIWPNAKEAYTTIRKLSLKSDII